jgi:cation transport regulator ChaB
MPYGSTSALPPAVKKLPAAKQRQFRNVFNSAYRRCKAQGKSNATCEKFAFRNAWGVVNRHGKNMEKDSMDCPCELTNIDEFSDENLTAVTEAMTNAAYAVVEQCWESNSDARHLLHHTDKVQRPDERISLSITGLRDALSRMDQIESVCENANSDIRARARAHLVEHLRSILPSGKFADAEWRNSDELLLKALDDYIKLISEKDITYTRRGWRMSL